MNFYDQFMNEFPIPVSASPDERVRINVSQVTLFESVKRSVESGADREAAWRTAKADVRKTKSAAVVWILWFLWNSGLLSRMFSWLWNRRSEFSAPKIEQTVDPSGLMG